MKVYWLFIFCFCLFGLNVVVYIIRVVSDLYRSKVFFCLLLIFMDLGGLIDKNIIYDGIKLYKYLFIFKRFINLEWKLI